MNLYPFQIENAAKARQLLETHGSVLLQMPTGSGKTVTSIEIVKVAAEIVKKATGTERVWFVCHRREILHQAQSAFTDSEIEHGTISPDYPKQPEMNVQIVSVDTLRHRSHNYGAPDLIIWDEAHHLAARTWAKLKKQFSAAKHLGLTATPERLDGKGLGDYFDVIIQGPSIKSLIDEGYLSKFMWFRPSDVDLTNAKLRAGDYADLDKVLNIPVLIGDALLHYNAIAPGSRALAFCHSVAASLELVAAFNKQRGPGRETPAVHIDGTTPSVVRDQAIEDLRTGKIKVISNVNVFTEGVDLPAVDTIILLRPTKSLALYLQMAGRGLRTCEGKTGAVILDHAGLIQEHGRITGDWEWSLEGGARKKRIAKAKASGERTRTCPECSCAHEPANECPHCGFEYDVKGHFISKFDGVLVEDKGEIPEGCVTNAEFARLVNVGPNQLCTWKGRGIPTLKGYILKEEGLRWFEDNFKPRTVDGFTSAEALARRLGVSGATVSRWKRMGLPVNEKGFIPETEAVQWLLRNGLISEGRVVTPGELCSIANISGDTLRRMFKKGMPRLSQKRLCLESSLKWLKEKGVSKHHAPILHSDSELEFIPFTTLAKMAGISSRTLAKLPYAPKRAINGWVERAEANVWLIENRERVASIGVNMKKPSSVTDVESRTKFCKRVGVSVSTISSWASKGLPCEENGWVVISAGLLWVKENETAWRPPVDSSGYESRVRFGGRVGTSGYIVKRWCNEGLPHAKNGWVHVAEGLRWVQANTNIVLPDSAWEGVTSSTEALTSGEPNEQERAQY